MGRIVINCYGMTRIKAKYSNVGLTSGKIDFLKLMQSFCGFDIFDKSNVLQMGA